MTRTAPAIDYWDLFGSLKEFRLYGIVIFCYPHTATLVADFKWDWRQLLAKPPVPPQHIQADEHSCKVNYNSLPRVLGTVLNPNQTPYILISDLPRSQGEAYPELDAFLKLADIQGPGFLGIVDLASVAYRKEENRTLHFVIQQHPQQQPPPFKWTINPRVKIDWNKSYRDLFFRDHPSTPRSEEVPELYALLELTTINANAAEIKAAYRRLVKQHHPDRETGDKELFLRLQKAYETLSDPQKRRRYDAGIKLLKAHEQQSSPKPI